MSNRRRLVWTIDVLLPTGYATSETFRSFIEAHAYANAMIVQYGGRAIVEIAPGRA